MPEPLHGAPRRAGRAGRSARPRLGRSSVPGARRRRLAGRGRRRAAEAPADHRGGLGDRGAPSCGRPLGLLGAGLLAGSGGAARLPAASREGSAARRHVVAAADGVRIGARGRVETRRQRQSRARAVDPRAARARGAHRRRRRGGHRRRHGWCAGAGMGATAGRAVRCGGRLARSHLRGGGRPRRSHQGAARSATMSTARRLCSRTISSTALPSPALRRRSRPRRRRSSTRERNGSSSAHRTGSTNARESSCSCAKSFRGSADAAEPRPDVVRVS